MLLTIAQLADDLRKHVEGLVASLPVVINLALERPSNFSSSREAHEGHTCCRVVVDGRSWVFYPSYDTGIPEQLYGKIIFVSWTVQIDSETGVVWVKPTYFGVTIVGDGNLAEMIQALSYDHTRVVETLGPLYRLGNPFASTTVLTRLGIHVDLTDTWIRRQDRDHILAELLTVLKLQDGIPEEVKQLLLDGFWRNIAKHSNVL